MLQQKALSTLSIAVAAKASSIIVSQRMFFLIKSRTQKYEYKKKKGLNKDRK